MQKPQDWGQPCPQPGLFPLSADQPWQHEYEFDLSTQSGKRRIFRCGACEKPFSETRDTVFFDLRTPEERVIMALKMLLVKSGPVGHWLCPGSDGSHRPGVAAASCPEGA